MNTKKGIIGELMRNARPWAPWWRRVWWKLFPDAGHHEQRRANAFLNTVGDQIAAKADTYPKYLWWRGHHIRIDAPGVVSVAAPGKWQPMSDELRREWNWYFAENSTQGLYLPPPTPAERAKPGWLVRAAADRLGPAKSQTDGEAKRMKVTHRKTLVYYDGPQLFVGEGEDNALYLCMALAGEVAFLCTLISTRSLDEFNLGQRDLLSIFLDVRGKLFRGSAMSEGDVIDLEPAEMGDIPEEWLPEPGFKLEFTQTDTKQP